MNFFDYVFATWTHKECPLVRVLVVRGNSLMCVADAQRQSLYLFSFAVRFVCFFFGLSLCVSPRVFFCEFLDLEVID